MRRLSTLLLATTLLALAACDVINSGLNIPARQEFLLGENQHGVFTAVAENEGDVPVTLYAQTPDGSRTELATLTPGMSADQTFPANTIAVFVNETDRSARIAVRITGDTNLSMGYEAE